MSGSYQLSCTVFGHTSDVRNVSPYIESHFISTSRDCTAKIWKEVAPGTYELVKSLEGHQHTRDKGGVSCSKFIPPGNKQFPDGAILTGGYDKVLNIWSLDSDGTCPSYSLIGHEGPVLCVDFDDDGRIITGSSDNSIIIWKDLKQSEILKGHSYPVWSVKVLENGDIVSASGDRTIKIWRNNQCIKTITSHKESVRCIEVLPDIGFISCSNDNVIKVWSADGEHIIDLLGHNDTVYSISILPNKDIVSASGDGTIKIWSDFNCVQTLKQPSGLWSVCTLPNSDIIAGCEDNTIRVWTNDPNKYASEEVIQANEKEYENFLKALKNETVIQKSRIGNQEYDYVVDVDLGEGPPLKLGFNVNDDPYVVAQNFINDHNLYQEYLDEIAKFIMSHTKKPVIQPEEPKGTLDPFTSRSSSETPQVKSKFFPPQSLLVFVTFKPEQLDAIFKKISQFNDKLKLESKNIDLSDDIISTLNSYIEVIKDTKSELKQEHVHTLFEILTKWPMDFTFPILDLIRLGLGHKDFTKYIPDEYLLLIFQNLMKEVPSPNQIMSLRCLSNLFKWRDIHDNLAINSETMLKLLTPLLSSEVKNVRSAASACIVNISWLFYTNPALQNTIVSKDIITTLSKLLESTKDDDILLRYLVTIGTLSHTSLEVLNCARENIRGVLNNIQSSDENVKQCIKDLSSLLK